MAARSKSMAFRGCAPLAFQLIIANPNYREHREGPCEDPSDGSSVAISLPRTNRKSAVWRSA
jgi:hypothetical protein